MKRLKCLLNFVLCLIALMIPILFCSFAGAAENDLAYLFDTSSAYYVVASAPFQAPLKAQLQAPLQAPLKQAPLQAPLKAELQAPSKLSLVSKKHHCCLFPGRATRLARRADRLEDRITRPQDVATIRAGITSLEPMTPIALTTASVVSREPGVCGGGSCGGGSCNSGQCSGRRGLFGFRR